MAATVQSIRGDGSNDAGKWYYGSWTTDGTKGDHVINFPRHVVYFRAMLDSGGTNPNEMVKHVGEADESTLITGSTGVYTSPADSAGVAITNKSNGTCTVDVASDSQTNSGVNHWIALCKP